MPGRDAFGREIGEDPLADLGWGTSHGGATEATPEAAPSAVTYQAPPAPAPVRLEPPGADLLRIGRWIRSLFTLGLLAVGVAGGISVIAAGTNAVNDVQDRVERAIPSGGGEPGTSKAGRSLLGRRPLGRALAALRRDVPGRVQTLRVAADRVDVTVRVGGGRTRIAQLRAGAVAATVIATTPGVPPAAGLFGYGDVEPAAMARALTAARRETGKGPAKVDYLTFTGVGGRLGWGVYYRGGEIVQADARGRFVRRIS